MELLSACRTWKNAFMALLVFDTVISASDVNEKVVKVMNDIQDCVLNI